MTITNQLRRQYWLESSFDCRRTNERLSYPPLQFNIVSLTGVQTSNLNFNKHITHQIHISTQCYAYCGFIAAIDDNTADMK